jgi:F0F1-type ATP synthase beta subunit
MMEPQQHRHRTSGLAFLRGERTREGNDFYHEMIDAAGQQGRPVEVEGFRSTAR